MRPLSELKQDFEVSRGLGDIIDVLKTAALIQFRAFQFKDKPNPDFLGGIDSCLDLLARIKTKHPYLIERKNLPSCIIAVTSDEGFLGELTGLLINAALEQRKSEDDKIIVLGERGARLMDEITHNFTALPGFSDEIKYGEAERLRDYLFKIYDRFGRIFIVYPKFVSLTVQRVTVTQLFPYQAKKTDTEDKLSRLVKEELLIEPEINSVIEKLVNLRVGFGIFEIFGLSKQSEYSARIMHLEGSTQELGQLRQKLSFEYFRQVHSLRDKVIREISAAKILLGKR